MKNLFIYVMMLFPLLFFSGCEVVGGIFKAGVWTGVLLVVVIGGVIIYVISRMGKGRS
jgi:hypothetical protein